jgi:hypothetical protein
MKINIIKNERPIKKRKRELLLSTLFHKENLGFNRIDNLNIIDASKNGYHIVSVGIIGLTYFSTVCEVGFGIKQQEQEILIKPIFNNKETGTIFPKAKLTILPDRFKPNAGNTWDSRDITGGEGFTTEEIKKHILDALQAETEYVQAGKVIFDFRDLGDEMYTYNSILHNIILNDFSETEGDIFYYSFNNKEFVTEAEFESYEILYTSLDKIYYDKRIKEQQEKIQQEKTEKKKKKELKRQQNEPKLIAQKSKVTDERDHIESLRKLNTEEKFTLIAKSPKVVYFYSEILNEILNNGDLKNFTEQITIILTKFKINETGKFKLLKCRLEQAIKPITND